MTIEEAIYCLKTYNPESDYSACFKCPYYGSTKVNDNTYICQSNTARKMAIEALKKESRRRQKMNKIKGIIENKENMKNGVWLSAPWYTYYHELEALFGQDPEISMDFIDEDVNTYIVTMHVRNEEKAYALMQLLPTVKSFGSTAVRIRVIPSNGEIESDYDLLLKALKGNPVFVKSIEEEVTDYNYILFKKEVVEFFNDELSDPYGFRFTLFQDIADDVFDGVSGVFFSTDRGNVAVPEKGEEKK